MEGKRTEGEENIPKRGKRKSSKAGRLKMAEERKRKQTTKAAVNSKPCFGHSRWL
jgi:hypothetical protein